MATDLRVIKTKRAIKKAFIDVVNEKGYVNIAVRDITDRAMINRNTFYLHYTSKDDLVEQLVKDVILEQEKQFYYILATMKNDIYDLDEHVFIYCAKALLKTLKEDEEFYRLIIKDNALRGYITRLSRTLKAGLRRALHLKGEAEYTIFEYMFSGFFGVIEYRFSQEDLEIEETSQILGKCFYSAVQYIKIIRRNPEELYK